MSAATTRPDPSPATRADLEDWVIPALNVILGENTHKVDVYNEMELARRPFGVLIIHMSGSPRYHRRDFPVRLALDILVACNIAPLSIMHLDTICKVGERFDNPAGNHPVVPVEDLLALYRQGITHTLIETLFDAGLSWRFIGEWERAFPVSELALVLAAGLSDTEISDILATRVMPDRDGLSTLAGLRNNPGTATSGRLLR